MARVYRRARRALGVPRRAPDSPCLRSGRPIHWLAARGRENDDESCGSQWLKDARGTRGVRAGAVRRASSPSDVCRGDRCVRLAAAVWPAAAPRRTAPAAERPAMPTAREVESAVAAVYPALVNISAVSRDFSEGPRDPLPERRQRRAGVRGRARADQLPCRRQQHAHSLHAHRRADLRRRCRRARPADRPVGPPVARCRRRRPGAERLPPATPGRAGPVGPAAGAARRRCRGRDRRPGPGPRQSVRALVVGDARHRLERPPRVHRLHRLRALGRRARRRRDDRLADPVDPARRADPARQLGRPAGESGRRGDRHQRARRRRHRLRHPGAGRRRCPAPCARRRRRCGAVFLGFAALPVAKLGRETGALVSSVTPGGPAEAAGLAAGDILLALNGEKVEARFFEQVPELYRRVAGAADRRAGDAARSSAGARRARSSSGRRRWSACAARSGELRALGISAEELTGPLALARNLRVREGVLVTGLRPGQAAATARPQVQAGDVLLAVERPARADARGARRATRRGTHRPAPVPWRRRRRSIGGSLVLKLLRGDQEILALVRLPESRNGRWGGELPRAWLGVLTQVLTPELAAALGRPGTPRLPRQRGLLVDERGEGRPRGRRPADRARRRAVHRLAPAGRRRPAARRRGAADRRDAAAHDRARRARDARSPCSSSRGRRPPRRRADRNRRSSSSRCAS